jgi:hypothetical protein
MKILKLSILLLAIISAPFMSRAQSGFDMLTVGPNTEALGLNEATSSLLLGASNIYSNPANLALEPSSSLNADYAFWIAGLNHTHVAANFKKTNSAIAFGLLAEQTDDFELRSRPGPPEGSFSVSYFSLAGSYAHAIKNISIGATFEYLREEIYIYDASGYAFNAGISSHWLDHTLILSASLLNVGKMDPLNLEGTELPSQLQVGASYLVFNQPGKASIGLPLSLKLISEFVIPVNDDRTENGSTEYSSEDYYFNLGVSAEVAESIILRAGYKSGETERPLSFGVGLNIDGIGINYALIPFKTGFGTVHALGLEYRF